MTLKSNADQKSTLIFGRRGLRFTGRPEGAVKQRRRVTLRMGHSLAEAIAVSKLCAVNSNSEMICFAQVANTPAHALASETVLKLSQSLDSEVALFAAALDDDEEGEAKDDDYEDDVLDEDDEEDLEDDEEFEDGDLDEDGEDLDEDLDDEEDEDDEDDEDE